MEDKLGEEVCVTARGKVPKTQGEEAKREVKEMLKNRKGEK